MFYILRTQAWQAFTESREETIRFNQVKGQPPAGSFSYILVPINVDEKHWVLGIIAHLQDLRKGDHEVRTAVFLLDSLPDLDMADDTLLPSLRQFAIGLAQQAPGLTLRNDAPTCIASFTPKVRYSKHLTHIYSLCLLQVPCQVNGIDCGFYPAHYAMCFMRSPARFEAIFRVRNHFHCTVTDSLTAPDRAMLVRTQTHTMIAGRLKTPKTAGTRSSLL